MATALFYKLSKRKNSTKQPTGTGTSFDVNLKSGTSFISPTLLLNNSGKPDYNYVSFEGSYYFIVDIVSIRQNLWEIYCKIDALATCKAAILASTQYVCYSSLSGGNFLVDTRIPILKSANVSSASSAIGILSSTGHYILSVVGKNSAATYQVSLTNLRDIIDSISTWESTGIQSAVGCIQVDQTQDFSGISETLATIGEALVNSGFIGNAYSQAPSCIRSCIWVPFSTILTDGTDTIFLGNFNTGVQAKKVSASPTTGTTSISIPWHYSDWRRAVCEEVYLYLPLVGMVSLPSDELVNESSITINYSVTATDGTIAYEVLAGSQVIGTFGANCCANYPIGINQQSSAGEIFNAFTSGIEKTLSAGVNSSLSPLSIAVGATQMAGEALLMDYNVENVRLSSHASCVGGIGGGAGIGLDLSAKCFTVSHPPVVNPSDMQATMGLPTMKPISLSTLTGYCQCANAHVELDKESTLMDIVDSYLNSGFYIE